MSGPSFKGMPAAVVVRTYFSPETLARVLDSVSRLDYPKDKLSIRVVATQGDEAAGLCVTAFKDKVGMDVGIAYVDSPSADVGRNAGIRSASADYLLLLDDDVLPDGAFLESSLVLLASTPNIAAVTAPVVETGSGLISKLNHTRFLGTRAASMSLLPCCVFRFEALTASGLYREDMGPPFSIHEDWELGSRLNRMGYTVLVDGTLPAMHLRGRTQGEAHARGDGLVRRALSYAREYITKNWWSMLQALKSGPRRQVGEYVLYLAIPFILAGALLTGSFWGLAAFLSIAAAVDVHSVFRGYYGKENLCGRLLFPLLLFSVRVVRAYLFAIGFLLHLPSLSPPDATRLGA